ncbi:MAG: hypothetical protein KF745_00005 [Phycisphaeraceae bacterium]|nr:hypothetical protein [Phycisphaeraceae bacterium]
MISAKVLVGAFLGLGLVGATLVAADPPSGSKTTEKTPAAAKPVGDPYPLAVCPVSGKKLADSSAVVVKVIETREIKFYSPEEAATFEADPKTWTAKLDSLIIADQKPHYAATTCVIMDEPLVEDGKDIGLDVVVNNRLIRVCCKECAVKVRENPAEAIAKVDQAVIAAQLASYPLTTCVVGADELGGMGDPVDVVIANRLVRLCCKGCLKSLKRDPAKYIAMVDAAYAQKAGDTAKPQH